MNLNLNDIENNMLPQPSQNPFWLYKFSSKHVLVWFQKKQLQKWCSFISWLPRTAAILETLWSQMSVYFCISP